MKIAFLVPELQHRGGIQTFALETYAELSPDLDIVLLDWEVRPTFLEKVVFHFLPSSVGRARLAALGRKRAKDLDLASYDVVHAWQIKGIYGWAPTNGVVTCHGWEVLLPNVRHYERELFRDALASARSITTPSEWTKSYLCANFDIQTDKITVVPPSIDVASFDVAPPPPLTTEGRAVIGTLTRFVKRKNLLNVIEALKILRDTYATDFTYRLAGDGPQRVEVLKRLGRSGIRYEYLGAISDQAKRTDFYPSLDVFVLPPQRLPRDVEGFGIVFVEANAAGVPVVAADTGGVGDAVRDGVSGLFADPSSPADIAAKVHEVLTTRADLRMSSLEWAKRFDRAQLAARFRDLYCP